MRGVALSGCSLVCAGRAASPFGHQSGGGWDARSAHCLSCVINPTPVALPCFLWGSGSRASGGVCVRAVCSGLGLRSCSATPPPPLADSVSAVSAGEGPRRPAPRVPGDTRRAAQDQPSEERQRHSDTAAAGVTGPCRLRGGAGGGGGTPRRAEGGGPRRPQAREDNGAPQRGGSLRSARLREPGKCRALLGTALQPATSVGARASAGGTGKSTDTVR